MEYIAYIQIWEESERGWGTRPDGYSLHFTVADAHNFRVRFLQDQVKWFESQGELGVPDEYTRPYGEPYPVSVDKELYEQLAKDKDVRFHDNNYPKCINVVHPR